MTYHGLKAQQMKNRFNGFIKENLKADDKKYESNGSESPGRALVLKMCLFPNRMIIRC
jgi:hypothetical protein